MYYALNEYISTSFTPRTIAQVSADTADTDSL